MKKLLLLPALLFLFYVSANAQWISVNGPYGGNIWQLKSNDQYVFAAKPSGLYRSADTGFTWEKCSNTIYSVLALDKQNLLQLKYSAILSRFAYSPDNGDHWQDVPLPNGITSPRDYTVLGNIILLNHHDSLWRTDDFGQHWTGFQVSGEPVHQYEYLEKVGDRFYLGNKKRLLSSQNGVDWTLVSFNVPGGTNEAISKIYSYDTFLFCYVDGTLARSTNGGQFWELANGPFGNFTPGFAKIQDTLFAGIGNKLIRSTDDGLNWDFVNPDGPFIDLLSSFGDVLLGNTYYKGVSRSSDFGQTFQQANKLLDGGDVYALSIKADDLWLWDSEGVLRQNAQQLDWNLPQMLPMTISGANRNWIYHFKDAVFVRQDHGDVFRTLDHGQTWTLVTPSTQASFAHVTKFEHKNDTLFMLEDFGRVWQTTDLGEHWGLTNTTIEAQIGDDMWDLTVQGGQVFITADDNIYRSNNNLQSWQLVGDSSPFNNSAPWIRLFSTPKYLFAWVDNERLFISIDQGENWFEPTIPFSPWFGQSYEDRVEFTEIGPIILGFFQNGGVFISKDQGSTWQDFNTGVQVPSAITDFDHNDSTLWLGTYDFGLFKRSISDLSTVATTQPLLGQNTLKIFPNPTQGTFTCKLPAEISGEATLTVFDLQGRQMLRQSTAHLRNIDLSHCAKGVYWVSIATRQGIFGGKVVLE